MFNNLIINYILSKLAVGKDINKFDVWLCERVTGEIYFIKMIAGAITLDDDFQILVKASFINYLAESLGVNAFSDIAQMDIIAYMNKLEIRDDSRLFDSLS